MKIRVRAIIPILAIAIGAVSYSACGSVGSDTSASCAEACDTNAACVESSASFSCVCNDGFDGNGVSCANIDECADNTHGCDALTTCEDSAPGYSCSACPAGTIDTDSSDDTTCETDQPDSMQAGAPGDWVEDCRTVANADLDGDGVDGRLEIALLVNGAIGADNAGAGRNVATPMLTIQYAIDTAALDPDRYQIYVASTDADDAEIVYAENIRLPRGVELFGGYNAAFSTRTAAKLTKVAPTTGIPLIVDYAEVAAGAGEFLVEGFALEAAAGTASAASSVGAVIQWGKETDAPEDAAYVRFINSSISADAGANGTIGSTGSVGLIGCAGKNGANSPAPNGVRTEGFQATAACYTNMIGGYGGAAAYITGQAGETVGDASGGRAGAKDSLGYTTCWCPATTGETGVRGGAATDNGTTVRSQPGAQALGSLVETTGDFSWVPALGADGGSGAAGAGGAGGGAGFGACGSTGLPNCQGTRGPAGGAGGGGGQGGWGGDGGYGGGGSIGILVAQSEPHLHCLTITTATGGTGGEGGPGGDPGTGGNGGSGGNPGGIGGSATGRGGIGGVGASGQPGLTGQGGRGGASVGLLLSESTVTGLDLDGTDDSLSVTVGTSGLGGAEVLGATPGYAGENGVAERVLNLTP